MGPVYLTSLLTGYHPGTSMCLRSDKEELLDNKRKRQRGMEIGHLRNQDLSYGMPYR